MRSADDHIYSGNKMSYAFELKNNNFIVYGYLQECLGGITDETAVFLYCTHPAMPVGRNLVSLDWLASSLHLKKDGFEIRQFEPSDFDGADARLKKLLLLNKALYNQSLG